MNNKLLEVEQIETTKRGITNIKELSQEHKHKEVVLYFHEDLDGVVTAILMREYLRSWGFNNFKLENLSTIQYGSRLAATQDLITPDKFVVLVDFAYGLPRIHIHTDHHDIQRAVDSTTATDFQTAASNAQTLHAFDYGPNTHQRFPDEDIVFVTMIDGAQYAKYNISMQRELMLVNSANVQRYEETGEYDREVAIDLAIMVNNRILAMKKKNIKINNSIANVLTYLVFTANASLYSLYQLTEQYFNWDRVASKVSSRAAKLEPADWQGAQQNKYDFIESNKKRIGTSLFYDEDSKTIISYGMAYASKMASYKRYVDYMTFPQAYFMIKLWPMGLMQISCNPFNKYNFELKNEKGLYDVTLFLLKQLETELNQIYIPVSEIKRLAERDISNVIKQSEKELSVLADKEGNINFKSTLPSSYFGYEYRNLLAEFGDNVLLNRKVKLATIENQPKKNRAKVKFSKINLNKYSEQEITNMNSRTYLNKVYCVLKGRHCDMPREELSILKTLVVPLYDIIKNGSGGHKCITNISGLNYIYGNIGGVSRAVEKLRSAGVSNFFETHGGQNPSEVKEKVIKNLGGIMITLALGYVKNIVNPTPSTIDSEDVVQKFIQNYLKK